MPATFLRGAGLFAERDGVGKKIAKLLVCGVQCVRHRRFSSTDPPDCGGELEIAAISSKVICIIAFHPFSFSSGVVGILYRFSFSDV
ncbi:MAG: hypothetical protein LBU32_14405 [Clostridiales bacterium]|jgi:hypothetical protein|nr:hypothetical protein [Clostridiales bacterium]